MNNNINRADYIAVMDHLRGIREEKKSREETLNKIIDKYYHTGETFKDRLQFRNEHEAEVVPLENEMATILQDLEVIEISIKVCKEMYAKSVVNEIIAAFKDHKKNLIDTPLHYKKFEKAFKEVVKNEECFTSSTYYTVYINFPYYNNITEKQSFYLCTKENNTITVEEVEKMKYYELIKPTDIVEIVKKRQATKAELEKMVEEFKANYNKLKEPFTNSNVLYIESKNIYL